MPRQPVATAVSQVSKQSQDRDELGRIGRMRPDAGGLQRSSSNDDDSDDSASESDSTVEHDEAAHRSKVYCRGLATHPLATIYDEAIALNVFHTVTIKGISKRASDRLTQALLKTRSALLRSDWTNVLTSLRQIEGALKSFPTESSLDIRLPILGMSKAPARLRHRSLPPSCSKADWRRSSGGRCGDVIQACSRSRRRQSPGDSATTPAERSIPDTLGRRACVNQRSMLCVPTECHSPR